MAGLYEQLILRHYHYPANHGALAKYDRVFSGANPFCGDEIVIYVKLDKHKKIQAIGWEGKGCVISQASASIFSKMIEKKSLAKVQKMKGEDLMRELHIQLSPTRMKCALLPLHTINNEKIIASSPDKA